MIERGRRRIRRRSQALVPPGEVVHYAFCARTAGFWALFVPYSIVYTALFGLGLFLLNPRLPSIGEPGATIVSMAWFAAPVAAGVFVASLFNRNRILAVTEHSLCVVDCG